MVVHAAAELGGRGGRGAGLRALWFINRNLWALAALPVLFLASRVDVRSPRLRAFYAYYPLHLAALWLIRIPMSKAWPTCSSDWSPAPCENPFFWPSLWRSWSARKAHWPPHADAGNFGTPIKSGVPVSFPDSSAIPADARGPELPGRRQECGNHLHQRAHQHATA